MIAIDDSHLYHLLTLFEILVLAQSGAGLEARATIIRRKPYRMGNATDFDGLIYVEDQKLDRLLDFEFAIHFGFDVQIGNPGEPIRNAGPSFRSLEFSRINRPLILTTMAVSIRNRCHAIQRRLHRAGGNLEWLKEKGSDAHGHRQGHE